MPVVPVSRRRLEHPLMRVGPRGAGTSEAGRMRAFWNARAREDALYFVDNRRRYRSDQDGDFWAGAGALIDYFLGGLDVALTGNEAVLEIGCGVGRMTRVLSARAARVIALDVADEMLARARSLNHDLANVRWELGDGLSLSGLAAASIDACVSTVVLQHVPDPEITLGYVRELGRVLRPGGWAALQISTDPAVHRPRGGWRQRLLALLGQGPRGQSDPAWLGAPVSLEALADAAQSSGLALERVWGAGSQYCQVLLRRT